MFAVLIMSMLSADFQKIIDELYKENYAFFFNLSNSILKSREKAEDAVAEAFLKIINNIERISSIPCHKRVGFCVVIVKHTAIDLIRECQKVQVSDDLQSLDDSASLLEDDVLSKLGSERLYSFLSKLPYKDRIILQLHYAEDMPYKEICKYVNMTEQTVRKRAERALDKLREFCEREGITIDG